MKLAIIPVDSNLWFLHRYRIKLISIIYFINLMNGMICPALRIRENMFDLI